MIELSSKQKGNLTELKCLSAFYELGYQCSIPYGENSRYDLIADIDGKLIKIQCKTSREVEQGVIEFSCRSCRSNTQSNLRRRYTSEEVDYFATMCNNQCYLIPYDVCGNRAQRVRLKPTKNGQTKGIVFAKDYKLEDIIEKM